MSNSEIDIWFDYKKEYKKRFKHSYDLFGLYWDNPQKDLDILIECIESNKPFSEVLSKEEMDSINEAKSGNILF